MAKHGFGSPINLGKHAPVWEFQSDKVVAAIARRTKHHSVAWIAQYLDCLCQEAGRQRWAVAIDQQDTVMSRKQQIARRAKQRFSKVAAALQHEWKLFRKQLAQHPFSSRRRIDRVAAPTQSFGYRFNRRGNVA